MEPDDNLLIINCIGIFITSIIGVAFGALVIAPYFFGG